MQFSTPIPIAKSNNPINYNSQIVSLGSCFAVNMGQKLDYFKFSNTINPFGILFHPLALEKFIGFAVNNTQFTDADIFELNGLWHCFDAHSDLSHTDKNILLNNLNNACALANAKLKQATHIIITLGTACVYRYTQTGNLVANCHKVPQKEFTKELLSTEVIKQGLENIISMLAEINRNLNIIFTVSPVRHIKDGFIENQWSKANLISGLHQVLITEHCQLNTAYFPSYEIMMDELRDYRYYAEDMIHPSATAVNYIWDRFTNAYITNEAQDTIKIIDNIQKGLQHRPFNPDTDQHKAFLTTLAQKMQTVQGKHPYITFTKDL